MSNSNTSSSSSSSSNYVISDSTTEIYYPRSKRRVKLNHKGEVVSDAKDK